jgi:hypothetical protein
MNIVEYVMLNSETSANYIPPKYVVLAASVGGSAGATNLWLQCVSRGIDTEVNLDLHISSLSEVWRAHSFVNEAAFKTAKAAGFFFVQKEVIILNTGPDPVNGAVPGTGDKILILKTGVGTVQGTDWEYITALTSSAFKGTVGEYSVQSLSDVSTYFAPKHILNGPFPIG